MARMHPLERLVNLLTLLLDSPRPLTFERIRELMPAYAHGDTASAKRMFERDKDALRDIGVPLEVVPTDAWEVEEGYVVPPERYYLPDVTFTPEEVAALFVAANAPGDERDAGAAFQKLSLGADVTVLTGLAAGASTGGVDASYPYLGAMARALSDRRAVRFSYRRADGAEEERVVDPFGLVFRSGTWYAVGHDRDRDEVRAFRLSRVTSDVREVGDAAPAPEGFRAADHVQVPGEAGGGSARVAFAEKVAWWAVRSIPGAREIRTRRDGWTEAEVPVTGEDAFVTWVAGFGPDARLLSPKRLRAALVEHLEAVRASL
jgi:proteasome accessory factor B